MRINLDNTCNIHKGLWFDGQCPRCAQEEYINKLVIERTLHLETYIKDLLNLCGQQKETINYLHQQIREIGTGYGRGLLGHSHRLSTQAL